MIRPVTVVAIAGAVCLGTGAASAGPCGQEITHFEQAVRQSAGNPNAGPFAPQTVNAQLGYQPTPASIKRANARAWATFHATLSRAKQYDARGNDVGCTRELATAKRMYNF